VYISNFLIRNSKKLPNKISFICNEKKITNSELYENVKNIVFNLRKIGLRKGNTIALILHNSIVYPQIFLAASYMDLNIAPLNPLISKNDILKQLQELNIKALFSWEDYLKTIDLKKININKKYCFDLNSKSKIFQNFDKLLINPNNKFKLIIKKNNYNKNFLFGLTSGSTSEPKVVSWSQKTKILRSRHAKKIYNLNINDNLIISTPMYHSISFRLIILPIFLNTTCIILDKFNKENWIKNIKIHKVTFSILVADQIEKIYQNLNNKSLKSLKTLVSCCSPLSKKIKQSIIKYKNLDVYDTYGASEVGTITNINLKKEKNKINSNGKPTPGYAIKILYNNKLFSKPNIEGEICCNTKNIFSGYYKNKTNYQNTLNNKYYLTGDIGYLDRHNYLYVTGRKKDIIIRGGINIYPLDIEKILNKFPFIDETCVIGLVDKKLGEKICVLILSKNIKKINTAKLFKYCINNLADYQIPSIFYHVKELPRGSLNKVSKYKIKKNLSNYVSKKNIFFNNYSIF
tara:strand:- start:1482 stop:3032 length:1551 start_codon:yes stop_codon:yes gene_type:complete